MSNRIDTYSSFTGLVIPVLSALTFSADGSTQLNSGAMDYLPTNVLPQVQVEPYRKAYTELTATQSSNTVEATSEMLDLLTLDSFAKKYLNNLTPIEDSIQKVIDDYFWEML